MTGGAAQPPGRGDPGEREPSKPALAALRAIPKVELHLHLDCCLSYAAAAKLSPGLTRSQYEQDFTGPDRVNGLSDFLSRTLNHVALLQTRDGLVTCVEDLAGQLERDNVIYAEVRFAPAQHTRLGLEAGEVVQIVADAIEALRGSSPVTMKLLLCSPGTSRWRTPWRSWAWSSSSGRAVRWSATTSPGTTPIRRNGCTTRRWREPGTRASR